VSPHVPHGLDHIVHTVRDLDAAGEFYRRAGFTVGARNRHDWGTHNRIVQLKNCFIELLEVAEPEKIVAHGPRAFSFGAFHRDYARTHEGLAMLLLGSVDADKDARAFEAAGISEFDVFNFAREGKKPDGTPVRLAFSLVFARDAKSPDLGAGLCQHHFPENFWNTAFQVHANGALAVRGVEMVAGNPADHHVFLEAFAGQRALHASSVGIKADVGNGEIEIMTPVAFGDRFGIRPAADREGATLNGLRFAVADLGETSATLTLGGIAAQSHGALLIVPTDEAFGAVLIFESAGASVR
jgi:Glyoxalase-like domain